MFLTSRIVQNFVELMDESDVLKVESMDDTEALEYVSGLYEKSYGAQPSGVAIYLLKTKLKLCSDGLDAKSMHDPDNEMIW